MVTCYSRPNAGSTNGSKWACVSFFDNLQVGFKRSNKEHHTLGAGPLFFQLNHLAWISPSNVDQPAGVHSNHGLSEVPFKWGMARKPRSWRPPTSPHPTSPPPTTNQHLTLGPNLLSALGAPAPRLPALGSRAPPWLLPGPWLPQRPRTPSGPEMGEAVH